MGKTKKYLLQEVADPVVNTNAVDDRNPTVLEFVTEVRSEASEKYGDKLNEKHQLISNGVRYSIAAVFKDSLNRYLLVSRKTIGNNPLANKNNRAEELALLEGVDFPLASRGILPDSSFKVGNVLDNVPIKSMQFIGIAHENPRKLGAKNDSEEVVMPCYEAEIDEGFMCVAAGNNGKILTAEEIIALDANQCSSKIEVLREYLQGKSN
jgi:hypothetical protein